MTLAQLVAFLVDARSRHEWREAIDDIEGSHSLPILTIHKSKGLEFNTVVFLGLEDDAFWGFDEDPNSETCALFVALSRARDRAVFTFSASRNVGKYPQKTRAGIESFYTIFEQAGVEVEEIAGI